MLKRIRRKRIISSGVTDGDMVTLHNLVTSQHLHTDFIQSLRKYVQNDWESSSHTPRLCEVLTAATLSKADHLTSVRWMVLKNIDISRIPPDSLASLATRVSWRVDIDNVTGDLTTIVGNIKCEWLWISNQNLSSEVTQCLVTAMRDNVEVVRLGYVGDVNINMELITQRYDGKGRCREVVCHNDAGRRYGQHLETWAARMGWKVDKYGFAIVISRKKYSI